jgi:uncharacterized membrane protein YgcG
MHKMGDDGGEAAKAGDGDDDDEEDDDEEDDDEENDDEEEEAAAAACVLGPTAAALLRARGVCEAAAAAAAAGDAVSATRLLFHAVLGRGGYLAESARHLRTAAVMRTLVVCKRCVDAEQCPPGCDGDHPLHEEVRCAGFMLLCLQAVFAGDAVVRAQAAAGAARAVQGWIRHFPPTWALAAGLVRRMHTGVRCTGTLWANIQRVEEGGVTGQGGEGANRDSVDGGGNDSNVGGGGGSASYEGEAAAAVLLLLARDLLRGHGGGSGRDPPTAAGAAAAAERASEAARLATLAASLHPDGAQPLLVRGLAHLQAHNFFLASLDLSRAAPGLPSDSPWAADAWQRWAEAVATATSIGQWDLSAALPVTAGALRTAARRGDETAAAAAALFGDADTSPSAPCTWDFGPMLAALEGTGDEHVVDASAMRKFQKEEQDSRTRAAAAKAENPQKDALAKTEAQVQAANARRDRNSVSLGDGDGAGDSDRDGNSVRDRYTVGDRGSVGETSSTGPTALAPAPHQMPTATRLSFNKTCASPGCTRADPRKAAAAGCGLVQCSHCEVAFWCSQTCASGDWDRHRTTPGECRPMIRAPTGVRG